MITAEQVTSLTAQTAKATRANMETYAVTTYDANGNLNEGWILNDSNDAVYVGTAISVVGVGVYGQSPSALVVAGYIKPGALSLITAPDLTATVLNTPAVWTGQFGINSLTDYLNYPVLQNLTQISLLIGSYQGLLTYGIITGNESARFQATFVQAAAQHGVDNVVEWVEGVADSDTTTALKITARQAQYAIDFIDTYSADLNVTPVLEGFSNTVVRTEIDQAVTDIIGNQKIPNLIFADEVIATITTALNEDGTFRFAPDAPRG